MDAALRKVACAAILCAPLLAACTQSPETVFNWDVNDHLPSRHYANSAPAKSGYARAAYARSNVPRYDGGRIRVAQANLPRIYADRGRQYGVPAPRPRPDYRPPAQRSAAYRPPAASGDVPTFVWPVSGPVIENFGKTSSGGRNDGINISTTMDMPIHAAAGGVVTYSGDELKDYGNLVLIRHADGYVTAYAHADRVLVSRGEKVARGQIIGYAGTTGDVSTPQLHFEIRHGTKPVNPTSLLVSRDS